MSRPAPALLLLRHGETAPNRDGLLLGRADPPLTPRGRSQARAAAGAIAALAPAVVVSSPLGRARETAEMVAGACGLPVEVDERLTEVSYGDWEGRPLAGVPAELSGRWRADPSFAPPGGESLGLLRERVEACVEGLLARGAEGPVVAVSHVSPIKAAVAWALGAGDEVAWRMFLGLASITRVEVRFGTPCLVSYNSTAHLASLEPPPPS